MEANDPEPSGPVTHILIGVDDSDGAMVALRWADALVANRLAAGADVRPVAVAAWSHPAFDLLGGLADADTLEQAAADMVSRVLGGLPHPDRYQTVVRPGAPADVLIDEANRLDAALVVVGTRGRGTLANLLLGGVSRSVAARAERPVAVVPLTGEWSDGPTVVGYDGSPGGNAALAWAVDNGPGPIRAVSAWHLPTTAIYEPGTIDVDRFEAGIRAELDKAIDRLADDRPDQDVRGRITPVIQRDDPRLTLVHEAKDAASIVLGARAKRGVRGLLLGSTVDYVASHSRQVVIVVPPPAQSSGPEASHG